MTHVDPTNAGTTGYRTVLDKIEGEGECPFCPTSSNYLADHHQPIVAESGHWFLTTAQWPYDDTSAHYLIVLKAHKTHISQLNRFEWLSLQDIMGEVELAGGALAIRFGDPGLTGATVTHLHAHILVPEINPTTGRGKPVYFGIGQKNTPS